MVRGFFVGLGLLLTFAATALTVLSNMGQLTQNVVARNIYFVAVNTRGLGDTVTTNGGSLYAGNQASAIGANQGLKYEYFWGMYDYCGGSGVNGNRDCSDSYIGYRWEPAKALVADAQTTFASQLNQTIGGDNTFTDDHYLGLLSRVANVIILVGTILTGLGFLTSFLAHRFCFAFAALECLGAAGCLATGAALWTAIIYKAKHSIPDGVGVVVSYGNALWMTWAAFGAVVLAIIPLIIACCVGRSKY
ncbi:unnamed protein product [Sympodiomycopsis kandeliae]